METFLLHLKHSFGHGKDGLANLLVVLNLLAFTLHSVLDSLHGLWNQVLALRDCSRPLQAMPRTFSIQGF